MTRTELTGSEPLAALRLGRHLTTGKLQEEIIGQLVIKEPSAAKGGEPPLKPGDVILCDPPPFRESWRAARRLPWWKRLGPRGGAVFRSLISLFTASPYTHVAIVAYAEPGGQHDAGTVLIIESAITATDNGVQARPAWDWLAEHRGRVVAARWFGPRMGEPYRRAINRAILDTYDELDEQPYERSPWDLLAASPKVPAWVDRAARRGRDLSKYCSELALVMLTRAKVIEMPDRSLAPADFAPGGRARPAKGVWLQPVLYELPSGWED
jgi:hypothetical protein